MSHTRKKIKSTSGKSSKFSAQNENSNDVLDRLDGLHSKAKVERKKVSLTATSNKNQIIAVGIIIIAASAGLVLIYNPGGVINKITGTPTQPKNIVNTIDSFKKDTSAVPLFINGKLDFLFVGGQFCPFCAMERWAVVMALQHYGNFSNLSPLVSAEDNVPTYDFIGATYSSNLITFEPFEVWNNVAPPNQQALESLPSQPQQIYNTYGTGAIPFICIGGSVYRSGAGISLNVNQFAGASRSTITSQIASKSGPFYSQISTEANSLVQLINNLLPNKGVNTASTTPTTTTTG